VTLQINQTGMKPVKRKYTLVVVLLIMGIPVFAQKTQKLSRRNFFRLKKSIVGNIKRDHPRYFYVTTYFSTPDGSILRIRYEDCVSKEGVPHTAIIIDSAESEKVGKNRWRVTKDYTFPKYTGVRLHPKDRTIFSRTFYRIDGITKEYTKTLLQTIIAIEQCDYSTEGFDSLSADNLTFYDPISGWSVPLFGFRKNESEYILKVPVFKNFGELIEYRILKSHALKNQIKHTTK
jgi:hypothetical protein